MVPYPSSFIRMLYSLLSFPGNLEGCLQQGTEHLSEGFLGTSGQSGNIPGCPDQYFLGVSWPRAAVWLRVGFGASFSWV